MTTGAQTAPVDAVNPFPGLRPFEPWEAYLFFGREKQTDELIRRLRQNRFLAVVGSSGSGKSSLVRAGLIPLLQSGTAWRIAVLRPGDKPLQNLALALYNDAQLGKSGAAPDIELGMVETTLRSSSAGLSALVQQSRLADAENLLVVVDQFEELFRYRAADQSEYAETAAAFIKLLLNAASDAALPIYIVITMRADFIGNCAPYPGLPKAVSDGQFLVPYPSRQELRRAITEPAAVVHCEIAARLVVRLLNEAGEDPDQLPVLQHALMRSWEYWHQHHEPDEPLDFLHYEAIGTMQRALSQHANEAYSELKSAAEKSIAEKAFRALVETDEQGRVIRRPTTLQQIAAIAGQPEAAVRAVIEHFRAPARAFVILRSDSFLDLSHESLIRIWTRLKDWAATEAQAANLYRRLARSADLHAKHEESRWVNPQLALAQKWRAENKPTQAWAERYSPNLKSALAFLDTSQRADRLRNGFIIAGIASIVILLIVVFALTFAANRQLRRDQAALEDQLHGLRKLQADSKVQVATLLDRQASLTKQITALTSKSGILVAELKSLHAENDSLIDQQQSAIETRGAAMAKLAKAISSNGSSATQLVNLSTTNAQGVAALKNLNAQNRDLMTRIVALKINLPVVRPLPSMAAAPMFAGSLTSIVASLLIPKDGASRLAVTSTDATFTDLLAGNAKLVAEADQLTRENKNLAQEAAALRQQNEKLTATAAKLREEIAHLTGEKNLLTSLAEVRKQQIADINGAIANLSADTSSLSGESQNLEKIRQNLSGAVDQMSLEQRTLTNINAALSNAIQAAQPNK